MEGDDEVASKSPSDHKPPQVNIFVRVDQPACIGRAAGGQAQASMRAMYRDSVHGRQAHHLPDLIAHPIEIVEDDRELVVQLACGPLGVDLATHTGDMERIRANASRPLNHFYQSPQAVDSMYLLEPADVDARLDDLPLPRAHDVVHAPALATVRVGAVGACRGVQVDGLHTRAMGDTKGQS